ncbi:hypothetical protein HPB47_000891, partial [Ixodes persulcatus]
MPDSVPGVGEVRTKNQKAKEAKTNTASAGPSVRHIARNPLSKGEGVPFECLASGTHLLLLKACSDCTCMLKPPGVIAKDDHAMDPFDNPTEQ